ncbi:serine hydrolase domain-containing protein [Virgibacillus oceani]
MRIEKRIQFITETYLPDEYFNTVDLLFRKDNRYTVSSTYQNGSWLSNQIEKPIFDLASLTKIITMTGILRLITEKRFGLETRLSKLLPLSDRVQEINNITVKELLTHSSGLRAWYPFYTLHPRSFLEALADIDLKHHSDSKVVYSDLNYMLLGEIIKSISEKNLSQFLQENIVEPLNLPSLSYGSLKENPFVVSTEFGNRTERKMVQERHLLFDGWRSFEEAIHGEVNDGNAFYYFGGEAGHAGLFGTTDDLDKILALYLKGGQIEGNEFINQSLVKLSLNNLVGNRGLGWHSGEPFPTGFGHTGFTGTSIWLDPENSITGIVLTNRLNVKEPRNVNGFRMEIHHEIQNSLKDT